MTLTSSPAEDVAVAAFQVRGRTNAGLSLIGGEPEGKKWLCKVWVSCQLGFLYGLPTRYRISTIYKGLKTYFIVSDFGYIYRDKTFYLKFNDLCFSPLRMV
jgi:hypothetical protein